MKDIFDRCEFLISRVGRSRSPYQNCGYPVHKDGLCKNHYNRGRLYKGDGNIFTNRCIYKHVNGLQCENSRLRSGYCPSCINRRSVIFRERDYEKEYIYNSINNRKNHKREYKYILSEIECRPYHGISWYEYIEIGKELVH